MGRRIPRPRFWRKKHRPVFAIKRTNTAPVVASGLSGLVVGVLLTLAVSALMSHGSAKTLPRATPPGQTLPAKPQLQAQIERIVARQLGPASPDPKVPRLLHVWLLFPEPQIGAIRRDYGAEPTRSVEIVFRLNDHPLGKSWRLRAAKGDVFRTLKALYTSGLPVQDVIMQGEFPLGSGPGGANHVAVTVYMSHDTAAHIAWKHIDRSNEGQVWRALSYKKVDPRFG